MAADFPIQVVLVVDRFPEIAKKLPSLTGQVVRKTALDILASAQQGAPVDTGNLKNSLQADEVTKTSWTVGTVVEYAPYVNYGTKRMAARPFLTDAAEHLRGPFTDAMKQLVKSL